MEAICGRVELGGSRWKRGGNGWKQVEAVLWAVGSGWKRVEVGWKGGGLNR